MTNEEESRSPSPGLRSVTLHRNRVLEGVRRKEAGRGGEEGEWEGERPGDLELSPSPHLALLLHPLSSLPSWEGAGGREDARASRRPGSRLCPRCGRD